jgi:iron complex outermembrane receptor protein/vitamin B12 transporter
LLPNLTSAEVQALMATLYNDFAYSLTLASGAFRAQGVETTVETGIGPNLFFRGGYTYLDAVVQRSFTSDNESLLNGSGYIYTDPSGKQIPVGAYTPLTGARPFRRPPHTGFFTATYTGKKLAGQFASSFASRSDDTTFLTYAVVNGQIGNMLLPNRNLGHGYAKLDLGGSYQISRGIGIYTQLENLLSQQHIGPIGYPSLPMTIRTGLRLSWGPGSGR